MRNSERPAAVRERIALELLHVDTRTTAKALSRSFPAAEASGASLQVTAKGIYLDLTGP